MLLLPSSALLGGLCFLVACISGSQGREQPIWRDSWMQPLLLAGLLMLVGCCFAQSGALAWAGLANWLPFFWAFWACRPHLETVNQRRQAAWMLVAGTVPVLVTGFGQMLLGWSGPWQLGGGAIVWFVAPGGQPSGRLSGLFDYANIAGAWLGVVWPLMLACVLRPDAWWRRSGAFALALSTAVAVVFTQSRNAMGALALALPLVIGPLQWSWLLPLLALLTVPLALAVLPGIPIGLKSWSAALLPDRIAERLLDQDTPTAWKHTRLGQWGYGIELVAARPWFGWGAAAFSVLYPIYAVKRWHGHSHNLPLELAISHGLPVTVLIVGTVFFLLVVALKRGMLRRDPLERAWWAAALVMVVMHATDLPLFDSRMNILGWVLLAGLANVSQPSVSQPSKLDRDALAVSGEPADL
jgi:O-antigen ligase